ncbi:MAG: SHOCT domain-containing protein [Desulfotignum sp.]
MVILLIVFLVLRIFKSQSHEQRWPAQDRFDSEAILKARYAKGEITREEFLKMKQTLSSS